MPRRITSSKRLNISTPLKFEEHGTSTSDNGSSLLPPQHKTVTVETPIINIGKPSDVEGDSSDSRVMSENVPQHLPSPGNPLIDKPRLDQIQEVLTHRRLLLLRIRQSKSAVELRLSKPTRRTIASTLSEYENNPTTSEIEAYNELTKIATLVSKKQRDEEKQPTEKRLPVSLRRGSSVGKRMNAAISTLLHYRF